MVCNIPTKEKEWNKSETANVPRGFVGKNQSSPSPKKERFQKSMVFKKICSSKKREMSK